MLTTIRKIAAVLLMVVAGVVALLYLISPIRPVEWSPPPLSPLDGPYAPDSKLSHVEWWAKQLVGPEAVAFSADGSLVAGLKDGRVVKLEVNRDEPTLLFETKGRPLAVAWHPDGRLIVCDAHRGLLAFSTDGTVEVLADSHGGIPFKFTDDLDIAKDGTIYFTDASARNSIEHFTADLLEHQTTGRVLKYVPSTKALSLVADGFAFTNGIALSEDESFLVVSETASYRLWKLPLVGTHAGEKQLFTDSLPGFPDNVRRSPSRHGFWVAIGSPRQSMVDGLSRQPHLRRIIAALPSFFQPKPARHSWVLLVDENGKPVESFQDDSPGSYSPIASAVEHDGWLYLGSFAREGVARFSLSLRGEGVQPGTSVNPARSRW